MKVSRKPSFSPVTIVLESPYELLFLKGALHQAWLISRDNSDNEKFLITLHDALEEEK